MHCLEYIIRRIKEGWKIIDTQYPFITLKSPDGIKKTVDIRNDIEILRPNAAGDETNISTQVPSSGEHWDKVDEEIADDNTTYVKNDQNAITNEIVWERDLYNLPAPSGSGTINCITVYARFLTDVSGEHAKIVIKTHGVVYEAVKSLPSAEWVNRSETWTTNPYTGEAWTWEEIDALQVGISLADKYLGFPINDYDFTTSCTQVYVEVDYTPKRPKKQILHLDKGPHPRSRITYLGNLR